MTKMLAEVCYDSDTGRGDPVKLQAALKLTFYQIRHVLCAPRDKEGKLILEPETDDQPSPEHWFTLTWIRRCLPRWLIAKKWQEELANAAAEEAKNGEHD